jgi:hypothetical protein
MHRVADNAEIIIFSALCVPMGQMQMRIPTPKNGKSLLSRSANALYKLVAGIKAAGHEHTNALLAPPQLSEKGISNARRILGERLEEYLVAVSPKGI